MYVVSKLNYRGLKGLAMPILVVACVLMLAVHVPGLGHSSGGATRWLNFPTQWQPSEVGKIALIIFFAARLAKRDQRKPLSFRRNTAAGRFGNLLERIGFFELVPYLIVLILMIGILYLQPHMSAAIQMVVIAAAILFAGGISAGWFIGGGTVVVGGPGGAHLRHGLLLRPDYHLAQPLGRSSGGRHADRAVPAGHWLRRADRLGPGQRRQKFLYLPEAQNDFIFAIVCEELGLIGACLILAVFALLIIRGYWLALHARDKFGALIVVGITTLFAFQVFANVAVVTNLFPVTGISMPFFSYGGTALIIQMAEMGLILGISRQNPVT